MLEDIDSELLLNPNGLKYSLQTGFRSSHRMRLLVSWPPYLKDMRTLIKLTNKLTKNGVLSVTGLEALSTQKKQKYYALIRRFEDKWYVTLTGILIGKKPGPKEYKKLPQSANNLKKLWAKGYSEDTIVFFGGDALLPLPPAPLLDEFANRHHNRLAERHPDRFFIVDAKMAGPEILEHLKQLAPEAPKRGRRHTPGVELSESDFETDIKLVEARPDCAADYRKILGKDFITTTELDVDVKKLRARYRKLQAELLIPNPEVSFP